MVYHRKMKNKNKNRQTKQSLSVKQFVNTAEILEDDESLQDIFKDWMWSWRFTRRYWKSVLFYVAAGILSSTTALLSSVAMKQSIDIITSFDAARLPYLVGMMIGFSALSMLLNAVVSRVSARITLKVYNDLQSEVFDSVMNADWLLLQGYPKGDLVNRFNSDISAIANNSISWLPNLVIALYQFIATFLLIFYYDKIMALIALAGAPLLMLISRTMVRKQRAYNRKTKEMSSELMSFEMESFYNIDMLKSFGITSAFSKRLRQWQNDYREIALKYNWFTIMTNLVMQSIGELIQLAAFGYCLFLLWNHSISFGTMTLFLQQRNRLTAAFNQLVGLVPGILNASVSSKRVRDLYELKPEKIFPGASADSTNPLRNIRFENVSFKYPEGTAVLDDVTFDMEAGKVTALIGPSGEGKTTLVRLILNLIHPDTGRIYIEDQTGRDLMNESVRSLISYVPQGNALISGSIADNLRMVKPEASEEEMIDALKRACAWRFVRNIPDTVYANLKEQGYGLSQGQGQRIAIARALLRDAPILLLDEATSALDPETEQEVIRNILKQDPEKIIIITTHRSAVLSACDRIYSVSDGKIKKVLTNSE